MEAIGELIAAVLMALLELLLIPLRVVVGLLGMVLEFIFLVLTQGPAQASDRFHQRRQSRRDAASSQVGDGGQGSERVPPAMRLRRAALLFALIVLTVVTVATGWYVSEQIRKRRIAATKVQIAKLADGFIALINENDGEVPQEGTLTDRDAWKQPIELFVDRALLGSMVVVRSSGPDGNSGTIDDLLAIRVRRAAAKEVGGELADRSLRAVRKRLAKFMPGKGDAELPDEIDIADE